MREGFIRIRIAMMGLLLSVWLSAPPGLATGADPVDPPAPLKIHIIFASGEYKSEPSLKEFTDYLVKHFRVTCTASCGKDGGSSLDNLDALPEAELLLVFAPS